MFSSLSLQHICHGSARAGGLRGLTIEALPGAAPLRLLPEPVPPLDLMAPIIMSALSDTTSGMGEPQGFKMDACIPRLVN